MQLEDYFLFISENDIRIKGHRLGIDNRPPAKIGTDYV